MHIRPKLAIGFLSMAVIPVLFVGGLSFVNSRDALLKNTTERLGAIASLKVDKIETFLNELKRDISIVQDYYNIKTNLPVVTAFYDNRSSPEYIKAEKILDGQLSGWLKVREELVNFLLVSPEGKIVYTANEAHSDHIGRPLSDPTGKAFPEGKKGIYISEIFKSQASGYDFRIVISAPAYDFDNKFIGVIAFEINMAPIYKFIQDTTGLSNTGETLLVRKEDHQVIFLNALRHDPSAPLKRAIVMGSKVAIPAQEAALKKSGSGTAVDYRGKEVLAAWRYIPSLDCGLVAKMDSAEVMAPVFDLRFSIAVSCLLVFVIAGIVSLSFADSIAKPIHVLHKGTEIIGNGNLDYKVGIDTKDEIGQLSRAFDKMTGKLKVQVEETKAVNQQLRASNQQLRATEQQLRASNQQLRASEQQLKAGNQQLRKSEEQVRLLVDSVKDHAIFMLDPQGNVASWNSGAEQISGYKSEEIIGRHFSCFYTKEDVKSDKPKHELEAAMAQERCETEGWRVRKDGSRFWADTIISVICNSEREIIGFSRVTRDLTERKKMDEQLLTAAEEWRMTFDSISDMVSILDRNYRIIRVNKSFADRLKMRPEEIIGKTCYELVHGTNEPPPGCPHKSTLETRMPQQSEYFEPYSNMYLEVTTSPIFNETGDMVSSTHIARDISQRKKLEKSQRLTELGELVADMAHEVNNPLMIISGNAELSLLDGMEDEEIKKNLKIIRDECSKAKDIIQRLLKFSRPSEGERKETDINGSIESVVKLIARQFKLNSIKIEEDLTRSLPPITIDEKQIQEVLLNLLNNAGDAMTSGGIIEISTSLEEGFVRTDVKDSGIGMDNETLSKIFEPFYTTKEKGTGLGLSVCYGIVKAHNGELKFKSEPGKGTTASMYLPLGKEGDSNA